MSLINSSDYNFQWVCLVNSLNNSFGMCLDDSLNNSLNNCCLCVAGAGLTKDWGGGDACCVSFWSEAAQEGTWAPPHHPQLLQVSNIFFISFGCECLLLYIIFFTNAD